MKKTGVGFFRSQGPLDVAALGLWIRGGFSGHKLPHICSVLRRRFASTSLGFAVGHGSSREVMADRRLMGSPLGIVPQVEACGEQPASLAERFVRVRTE